MTVQVEVQNACEDDTAPEIPTIKSWVTRAAGASRSQNDFEVSIRIVDAREMRALNNEYRGKDKPTNVLAFPTGDFVGLPAGMPAPLGDIIICASVVRDEAAEQGKAITDHWAHMLVHGTLHLLGYDHETQPEAAEMEELETRVLSEHGLADPYGAPDET